MIGIARSADSDPSLFFPDGVSPSTTDIGNTRGELSSDLFSGSDSVFDQTDLDSGFGTDAVLMSLDPQWLSFDDSDLGVLEASCTGDNGGTQTIDKMRREDRQTCAQQLRKNNPDFSNLQLPTFMQIEETLKGAQTKPDVNAGTASEEEDDDECPEPYGRRVCCSGRGVRTFEGSGIWDFVHGCNPRTYLPGCKNLLHMSLSLSMHMPLSI